MFDYGAARQELNADIFWLQAAAQETLRGFLEMAQTTREGKRRGIVEVRFHGD